MVQPDAETTMWLKPRRASRRAWDPDEAESHDSPTGPSEPDSLTAQQAAFERTAVARIALSGGSLVLLTAGATAAALGAKDVRVGALLAFFLLGPGSAPWSLNRFVRLPARLTLTAVTGFSILTFGSLGMISAHSWHPTIAFLLVTCVTVPLHIIGVRLAFRDLPPRPTTRARGVRAGSARTHPYAPPTWLSRLCVVAGAALCMRQAATHRHVEPGWGGFTHQIGFSWYLGLALIILAIALYPTKREPDLAIAVLVLMLILTLTPALVYDGPKAQTAEKHVDLIQQIRIFHRPVADIDVYNNWDGFFAAIAWLCEIAGIADPIGLARFWPPLIGVFWLITIRYLAEKTLPTAHQRWIAVALAVLANPIGADYFSPQSVGFMTGVAIYGLALADYRSRVRLGVLFTAGSLLTVSHQLSPFIVGGVLVILSLFRQVRPVWTPAFIVGPALLWSLTHWGSVSGFVNLNDIGMLQNFSPPKTQNAPGLARLPIVGETAGSMFLGLVLLGLTAAVALIQARRIRAAWAYACCPTIGLVLIAINPYGNEGIFRATLFAIPWLAVLGARIFANSQFGWRRLPLFLLSATLVGTFLVAAFGLDAINVIRRPDLDAYRYVLAQADAQPREKIVLLSLGSGELPFALARENRSPTEIILPDLPKKIASSDQALADESLVGNVTARLVAFGKEDPSRPYRLYVVWSPVTMYYGQAYGLTSRMQFESVRAAFHASPYWSAVQDDGGTGTILFEFKPDRYPGST